jgi:ABC-type Zn uptake system ZnuABC Zn-binding protein ZnuA
LEALIEAVSARGFKCKIGAELYSDSLGDGENYIETFKANIDAIAEALHD